MKTTKLLKAILVLGGALFLLMYPVSSKADTFTFFKITNNGNPDVAGQLSVDVTGPGGNQVSFTFYNDVGIASSITDIYFDDGTLLSISLPLTFSSGVAFSTPATPGNLPSANSASPPFVTTDSFSMDSNSGPPGVMENGVDSSTEWVTITFNLINLPVQKTFNDTLAALEGGSLRIGLHVQAIGPNSGSDSYVNDGPVTVPEPGILILLGIAMSAIGMASWRITKI
jgi:hypothetical protein